MSFRCVSEYDILEMILLGYGILSVNFILSPSVKAVLIIIWFLSINYKVIKKNHKNKVCKLCYFEDIF